MSTVMIPSDEQLARYLSGETSLQDRLNVEQWVADHPTRQALISRMAAVWDEPRFSLEQWDQQSLSEHFVARRVRIAYAAPLGRSGRRNIQTRASVWRWVGTVAALCVVVAVMAVVTDRSSALSGMPTEHALQTYRTVEGQRAIVTLTDGSVITLAPTTELRVGSHSNGRVREVQVTGAAYFTVAQSVEVPFVVQLGDASIRILGTSFGVRYHDGDTKTEVAVTDGRISVSSGNHAPALLSAGDVGRMDSDGKIQVTSDPLAASEVTGWKSGQLVFEDLPMSVIAQRLSKWFGLDVRVAGSLLAERTVTATFQNEDDRAVLNSLAEALGVRIERAGHHVTFFAR